MATKSLTLFCDSCEQEFVLKFKGRILPQVCPFCAEEIPVVDEFDDEDENEYDDE